MWSNRTGICQSCYKSKSKFMRDRQTSREKKISYMILTHLIKTSKNNIFLHSFSFLCVILAHLDTDAVRIHIHNSVSVPDPDPQDKINAVLDPQHWWIPVPYSKKHLAGLHADNLEDGRKELRVRILLLLLLLEGEVEVAQQQVLLVTLPLGRAVAAATNHEISDMFELRAET